MNISPDINLVFTDKDTADLLNIGLDPHAFSRACWIAKVEAGAAPDPARLEAYLSLPEIKESYGDLPHRGFYTVLAPAFGGTLNLTIEDGQVLVLDEAKLQKGVEWFLGKNPEYVGEDANDTLCMIDELCADAMIQFALFGKEVYG